jgi:hypothetical protein
MAVGSFRHLTSSLTQALPYIVGAANQISQMSAGGGGGKKPNGGRVRYRRPRQRAKLRLKTRKNFGPSATRTKKKRTKPNKTFRVSDVASGTITAKIGLGRSKVRPQAKYRHQQQRILEQNQTGQQTIFDVFNVMNEGQIYSNSMPSSSSTVEVLDNSWFTTPFLMDPNYNITGGPLATAEASSAGIKNKQCVVRDIQGQIRIGNYSNNGCDMQLFFVTIKKGSDVSPLQNFGLETPIQQFVATMIADNNVNQLQTGASQRSLSAGPTGGTVLPEATGYNPFSDPNFRRRYRLIKKLNMTLMAGDIQKVNFRFIYDRAFTKRDAYDAPLESTPFWIPNTTVMCFAICKGHPALVTTTTPVGQMVSPGPYKIGCEINYTVDIGYKLEKTANKLIEYCNYNAPLTTIPTSIKLINQETDAPVDYNEA